MGKAGSPLPKYVTLIHTGPPFRPYSMRHVPKEGSSHWQTTRDVVLQRVGAQGEEGAAPLPNLFFSPSAHLAAPYCEQ